MLNNRTFRLRQFVSDDLIYAILFYYRAVKYLKNKAMYLNFTPRTSDGRCFDQRINLSIY
jgi:hypothetical protein